VFEYLCIVCSFKICILRNLIGNRIQDDYKLCVRLHELFGEKVLATQKLNTHFVRMRVKKLFELLFTVACVFFVLILIYYQYIYLNAIIIFNNTVY
jgi:hypothetical protein